MREDTRSQYRFLIEALVDECREGQAFPRWVRSGVWNRYALDHPDEMPEEHEMNSLLARLGGEDRDVVARMVEKSYAAAIHNTLRLLHDNEIAPFDESDEGTPYQDFAGLLQGDWEWPT
jgi:hypothetical protein